MSGRQRRKRVGPAVLNRRESGDGLAPGEILQDDSRPAARENAHDFRLVGTQDCDKIDSNAKLRSRLWAGDREFREKSPEERTERFEYSSWNCVFNDNRNGRRSRLRRSGLLLAAGNLFLINCL